MPGEAGPSTPDRPADLCPDQPAVPATSKKASKPAVPPKAPAVTTKSIASRTGDVRETAWRAALIQAGEGDPEILRAFEAVLRDTWKVDAAFLGRFGKDELKFIAQECGLVQHMGTKAFAKLLQSKTEAIVAGMLNATGFDWAGRLPSAVTLDGIYGAPLTPAALTEKDATPC
jgi:hypothetical protein